MTARLHPGRSANDNAVPFDVTRASLMAFGPGLLITLVVTTIWLVSVW